VRIAQIASLHEAVPPRLYGGSQRVVAHLCDALVDLGHEVTLFATSEARTRAGLVCVRDQAIRLDTAPLKSDLAAHLTMLHEVECRSQDFDLLHFHIDMLHFPFFEQQAHKCVTTLHGRLDIKDVGAVYARWPAFGLVSISNAQRAPLPRANWLATIPNGVPPHQFPFKRNVSREAYLAFLGRISPEKRPDVAIRLALRARQPLKIAAKVDAFDREYFNTLIRPMLNDPLVEFVGEIDDVQKARFLGEARALLFPIDWPEPFGLVMIEAMACGTPVVAWNRGSVGEVIEQGISGYIVNSEEEAMAAIDRIPELDRHLVRSSYQRRFTSMLMASAYAEVYMGLIEDSGERSHRSATVHS
jgi:glycosyltransferase involved in cell wall biosynthesis